MIMDRQQCFLFVISHNFLSCLREIWTLFSYLWVLASLPFQFSNSLDTSCSSAIVLEKALSMRNAFLFVPLVKMNQVLLKLCLHLFIISLLCFWVRVLPCTRKMAQNTRSACLSLSLLSAGIASLRHHIQLSSLTSWFITFTLYMFYPFTIMLNSWRDLKAPSLSFAQPNTVIFSPSTVSPSKKHLFSRLRVGHWGSRTKMNIVPMRVWSEARDLLLFLLLREPLD